MGKENKACKLRLDSVARFPKKNDIRPTRIHKQVPVTERAVFGLRLGQISVQFVGDCLKNAAQTFDYDRNLISLYDLDALLTQRNVKNAVFR